MTQLRTIKKRFTQLTNHKYSEENLRKFADKWSSERKSAGIYPYKYTTDSLERIRVSLEMLIERELNANPELPPDPIRDKLFVEIDAIEKRIGKIVSEYNKIELPSANILQES